MTKVLGLVDLLKVDQEGRWRSGRALAIEAYLDKHPQLHGDQQAVLELVCNEVLLRREQGQAPSLEEYARRFEQLGPQLREWFGATGGEAAAQTRVVLALRPGGLVAGLLPPVQSGPRFPEVPGYEVLAEVGRGGMGVVYKARDLRLKRLVALKMILAGACANPLLQGRFHIEAEAVARLQHPNIVQIYEVGAYNGLPFLTLEYVDGLSLDQAIPGALEATRAAGLMETIARAMHHAHLRQIVHRDLKPSNILLGGDGIPKITDFGLAKLLDVEAGPTPTEALLGTPSYMAPEQAAGKQREVGAPADVYALGAILYHLLTGRPPFQGKTLLNTLEQVRTQDPIPPTRLTARLPRDLERVCLKCLEKEPGRRYRTAEEMADDLRRFQEGKLVQARPAAAWRRWWRGARRRPALIATLVAAVALVCLAGTLVGYRRAAEQAGHYRSDQAYERFLECRNEALYHGLLASHGGGLATGSEQALHVQAAETAARQALALAGVDAETGAARWRGDFTDVRAAEVVGDCYTLLLILADLKSQQTQDPMQERSQAALQALDSAARLGLDTPAYHHRRAAVLTRLGRLEEARQEKERAATVPPQSALDHFLAGEELFRGGAWTEAAAIFHRALSLQPGYFWAQFFLAVCHLRLQQWEAARASLTACLALQPRFVWPYVFRSFVEEKLGAHGQAEEDFEAALQLEPEENARYTLLLTRGVLRFQHNELDQAERDFQAARALEPGQYNAAVNLAWVSLARGDFAQAARRMEQARSLQPPPLVCLGYYVGRAHYLSQAGQQEAVLEACSAALAAVPDHPLALAARARALLQLKRYDEAEQTYSQYLRHGGEPSSDVFRGRGLARMQLGRYPDAVEDYTHALQRQPDAELYQHRGWAHFFSDAWKLARRDFDRAIELGPEQADSYVGRGLASVMLGATRPALADAEQAICRRPATAEMWVNLACIFAQLVDRVDKQQAEPDRQSTIRQYRKQSVDALRQALNRVPFQDRPSFWRDKIVGDPALAPVRGCPEFQQLQQPPFPR